MGGDLGSRPCVSAAAEFLRECPSVELIVVGCGRSVEPLLHEYAHTAPDIASRMHFHHAESVIGMNDDPAHALRHGKESSMWQALLLLANGKADACVSAGNTGALMAISRYLIKTVAEIQRPAICKAIPTPTGTSVLLDLGANLNCTSNHLFQFAHMGRALAETHGVSNPSIALLNIGTEVSKGGDVIKHAAALLTQDKSLNYVGFIEGDELYSGRVNVIVCDGFVGNVALKVSEGLVRQLIKSLRDFFASRWWGRLTFPLTGVLLRRWSQKRNPSLYNGAAFLGLRKPVIKSHGNADSFGFLNALREAYEQACLNVPARISQSLN